MACQFQKVSKSGFFYTQLEAIQEHSSSFNWFTLFLKHLGINEELRKEHRQLSITVYVTVNFVPDKHARISLEQSVINKPFGT